MDVPLTRYLANLFFTLRKFYYMRNDSPETSVYAMEKLIFGRVLDNDRAGDDSPVCITNIRQKIPISPTLWAVLFESSNFEKKIHFFG